MDIQDLFGVKGKVILVTGGGKGIGKMIATAFAINGSKVYICGRSIKDLEDTAGEVNQLVKNKAKTGGVVIPIQCDMQSLESCREFADELGRREDKLNVLVHNSGASWGDALDEYPDAAWTKLLTLNLQRVFSLTQMLLPLLRKASSFTSECKDGSGSNTTMDPARIINIGSIAALSVPTMENYAYSASKAGLHHLSRHLAVRLGQEGITSNTIACGPFETKMMRATLKNFRDTIESGVPLGRIGTPEDVGGVALFLAGRSGAFVNGSTITLDGGAHLVSKV